MKIAPIRIKLFLTTLLMLLIISVTSLVIISKNQHQTPFTNFETHQEYFDDIAKCNHDKATEWDMSTDSCEPDEDIYT